MNILKKIFSLFVVFSMTFGVALASPQNKITVCHFPPGNPDNAQTIEINESAWSAHQAHGDYQGECQSEGNGNQTPIIPVCNPQINLIPNGGFETPDVTNGSGWQLFDDGQVGVEWNVDWNGAFVGAPSVAKMELHGGVNGWLPYEGSQYAELDSDWGVNNGEEASTKISQTLLTEEGMDYVLGYAFSPRPNTQAADNVLEVLINGNVVATHGPVAGVGNTSWTYYTYNFTADGSVTEVSFRDAGNPNSVGTFIDAVSVNCVEGCDENGSLYARIKIQDISTKWRNWNIDASENPMSLNVYVGGGDESNIYAVNEWFPLVDEDGNFINDPDIASYRDVPGLAVQRQEGSIRVVLYGGHEEPAGNPLFKRELAAGSIELSTDASTRLWDAWEKEEGFIDPSAVNSHSRIHDVTVNDPENPMDHRTINGYIHQYHPQFDKVRVFKSLFQFHLVVTTGSDGFYARYDSDVVANECEVSPQ